MRPMLIDELSYILKRSRSSRLEYKKVALKEYLQDYVLNFIYTNDLYKDNFIFTGGTALRKVYKLGRLSEDIDINYLNDFDIQIFRDKIYEYFQKKYEYLGLDTSIKQKGRQLLLKFPVLKSLELADESQSELLHLKIDFAKESSQKYLLSTKLITTELFSYIVKVYDLSSMMANKMIAILTRSRFMGLDNVEVIKGRDYFDLLWFLEKKVKPNIPRIEELFDGYRGWDDFLSQIDNKVELATSRHIKDFRDDLIPFIDNFDIVLDYVSSYAKNYHNEVKYLNEE